MNKFGNRLQLLIKTHAYTIKTASHIIPADNSQALHWPRPYNHTAELQ